MDFVVVGVPARGRANARFIGGSHGRMTFEGRPRGARRPGTRAADVVIGDVGKMLVGPSFRAASWSG